MYSYQRPSFNTDLPPMNVDGVFAGSQRHVFLQDDIRLQPGGGKDRTSTITKPKLKSDPLATTRAPTKATKPKKKRKRKKRK